MSRSDTEAVELWVCPECGTPVGVATGTYGSCPTHGHIARIERAKYVPADSRPTSYMEGAAPVHPILQWTRGMCMDEEPYTAIEAKLAEAVGLAKDLEQAYSCAFSERDRYRDRAEFFEASQKNYYRQLKRARANVEAVLEHERDSLSLEAIHDLQAVLDPESEDGTNPDAFPATPGVISAPATGDGPAETSSHGGEY